METHTHIEIWLTPPSSGWPAIFFLRQDRRAGGVIVTGLQLITTSVWAAYTRTLGGKWTRWKTRILLWRLMMGCPACAAGRPAPAGIFLVFPIHPPVSWIHMDSEEKCIWPFSYITGVMEQGGEEEGFFLIVYCVDKVQQRESCVILNYKLQLCSRWTRVFFLLRWCEVKAFGFFFHSIPVHLQAQFTLAHRRHFHFQTFHSNSFSYTHPSAGPIL